MDKAIVRRSILLLLANYADPLREIRDPVNQQILEWRASIFVVL